MSKPLSLLRPVFCHFSLFLLVSGLSSLTRPSLAFAEDSPKSTLSFQVNHSVLSYYDTITKSDLSSSRQQNIQTTSSYTEVVLNLAGYHLHLFPVAEGTPIQVGYDLFDGIECGLTLAHNSGTQKDVDYSRKSNLTGIYAVYAHNIGSTLFEVVLGVDALSDSTTVRNEQNEVVRTRYKGSDQYFGLNLIHNISGSLSAVVSGTLITTQQKDRASHDTSRLIYMSFTPIAIRLDF